MAAAWATVVDLIARDKELAAIAGPGASLPVRTWRSPPGEWRAPVIGALLVLEGVLLRSVRVGSGLEVVEVVGRGDVIVPAELEEGEGSFRVVATWTATEAVTVALLDAQAMHRLAALPEVAARVLHRSVRRAQRLAVQLAIISQPRVEERLLLTLWYLADRFGRVTRDGVVLPLRLPHRLLAKIVRAGRPTVTTAVGQLAAEGFVGQTEASQWILKRRPPTPDGTRAAMLTLGETAEQEVL